MKIRTLNSDDWAFGLAFEEKSIAIWFWKKMWVIEFNWRKK
jgi:hypothetical protein